MLTYDQNLIRQAVKVQRLSLFLRGGVGTFFV